MAPLEKALRLSEADTQWKTLVKTALGRNLSLLNWILSPVFIYFPQFSSTLPSFHLLSYNESTTYTFTNFCIPCAQTNLYEKRDCYADGKDEHSTQTVKVKRPSSHSIHQRYGDKCHDHHDAADTNGSELGTILRETGTHEQIRWIVEHLEAQ